MNSNETDRRKPQTETLIVAKTDDGYRVCSPLNPATQFLVKDDGEDITCTCAAFQEHQHDPLWQCSHIKAVIGYQNGQNHPGQNHRSEGGPAGEAQAPITPPPTQPKPKKPASRGSDAEMRIKRSVSPDGHVDSLSVEFTVPVGQLTTEEIKQNADRALKLQGEITQGFLKQNGNGASHRSNGNGVPPRAGRNGQSSGITARLLNIEAMDTRRGRSLYLNVLVQNQVAKLFGNEERLGEALNDAGYGDRAEEIAEGVELDLPCRAVTKRNGKYLNIERLLPAPAENGG